MARGARGPIIFRIGIIRQVLMMLNTASFNDPSVLPALMAFDDDDDFDDEDWDEEDLDDEDLDDEDFDDFDDEDLDDEDWDEEDWEEEDWDEEEEEF